jgi:hypothetical protein
MRAAPMMSAPSPATSLAVAWLAMIAAIALGLHLACLTRYGWFRDELYYMVCADHPSLGYVDHPPLSIWLLLAWRTVFGSSLAAIRWAPALAQVASVFLTGMIARELGGGRWAQALAALGVALSPVVLAVCGFYSMNALELAIWPLATLLLIRALRASEGIPALAAFRGVTTASWTALGIVLGLGLLNKVSTLWLGAGFGIALLLTPHRRVLVTRGPYLAAAIAGLMFVPHVVWQVRHGWPTLEFMHNATTMKMQSVSALGFLQTQIMAMGPWTVPLWVCGLVGGLVAGSRRDERLVVIVFAVVALLLVFAGTSRASYLTPAYPALIAAGAVSIVAWTHPRALRVVRVLLVLVILAGGAIGALVVLPLLSVDDHVRLTERLHVQPPAEERQRMGPLPQHLADMFGWEDLAAEVARIYAALPPGDRAHCAIFAQNYGEAGALTVLGRARGLPPARSGHNNFWLWGPGPEPTVMIVVGGDASDNAEFFDQLVQVATWDSPYAMPYERHMPIYVGRGLKRPLREAWPQLKRYI